MVLSPPRKEIDLAVALGQLLPQPLAPILPPPVAPDDFEDSVVLPEDNYDEWTLDADDKHANSNVETINAFI